jgi:hypothetical protein
MPENKFYWCPTCKNYPDTIFEIYKNVTEKRTWANDCYELDDVDYGCMSETICAECDTPLEFKGEEDALPLPEMPREIGNDQDLSDIETD